MYCAALSAEAGFIKMRRLVDLRSVGPAMLKDFELLKIRTVDQLAKKDPQRLFLRLCKVTKTKRDPCVLDTFSCAVAQARDPRLPNGMCNWWYWSKRRKARGKSPL
jgi:hypothetical protein